MSKASSVSHSASSRTHLLGQSSVGSGRLAEGRASDKPEKSDGRRESTNGNGDVFCNHDGERRILRGAAIYSGAPRLAELAARIGFDTVWIEMEHGPTDYLLAEHICMA